MDLESTTLQELLTAVDATIRFASRGCSAMACDRVRGAWLSHQLGVIGRAASALPEPVRESCPGVPWDKLVLLIDSENGIGAMSGDQMQRFAEQELPRVKEILKKRLKRKG